MSALAPSRSSPLSLAEYGAIFLVASVWGVNNAAAKIATETLPPMLVGALRFALTLVVLAPMLKPPFPSPKNLLLLAVLAGPVHFSLIYLAFWLAHDLSPLAVSLQLWIPFTAILSGVLLKEPLGRPAILGLVIAFAGMAIMTLDPHAMLDWVAIVVGALASTAWAFATITARKTPAVHPLKMQALCALLATPVLGAASWTFERDRWGALTHASPLVWGTILFAGIGSSVFATGLMFWLVQRREAGRVTPYMLTSPLISCLIGVGLLHDVMTPQIAIGGSAVICGVGVVALAERGLKRLRTDTAEAAQAAESP
jgi:O-acetylserine/cysteine efflux transporter